MKKIEQRSADHDQIDLSGQLIGKKKVCDYEEEMSIAMKLSVQTFNPLYVMMMMMMMSKVTHTPSLGVEFDLIQNNRLDTHTHTHKQTSV